MDAAPGFFFSQLSDSLTMRNSSKMSSDSSEDSNPALEPRVCLLQSRSAIKQEVETGTAEESFDRSKEVRSRKLFLTSSSPCCPTELSTMIEMLSICAAHYPHVTVEQLRCDYHN